MKCVLMIAVLALLWAETEGLTDREKKARVLNKYLGCVSREDLKGVDDKEVWEPYDCLQHCKRKLHPSAGLVATDRAGYKFLCLCKTSYCRRPFKTGCIPCGTEIHQDIKCGQVNKDTISLYLT